MADIATAYVQILPSTENLASSLTSSLTEATNDASTSAGSTGGSSFASSFSSAISAAGSVISSAVSGISSAVSAVASGISDVAEAGDEIDKSSQKVGVTAEQYQALSYAAEHCGFSTSALQTAANNLTTNGFDGSLYDAIEQIQGIEDADERAAAATELLGTRAAAQMSALIDGEMTIDDYSSSLEELGGMMSNESVAAAASYEDSLTDMQTAMTGIKNNLLSSFLPGMSDAMSGLAAIFSGDSSGLEQLSSGVSSIANAIVAAAPTLIQAVVTIGQSLITAIITNLPTILQSLMAAFNQILLGIVDLVQNGDLIGTIVDCILLIFDSLIDNIDVILSAVLQIILAVGQAIIENLPEILASLLELVVSIADWLITDAIPMIWNAINEFLTPAGEWLANVLNNIITWLGNIWTNITTWFTKVITGIKTRCTNIFNSIKSAFANVLSIGTNIVTGIWNGISNGFTWIKTKITGWCTSVINWFKSVLGIGSPSKVMRDEVGTWIGAGVAEGITDSTNDALNAADTMMAAVQDTVSGDVNFGVSGTGGELTSSSSMTVAVLNQFMEQLSKMGVYLNGTTLVGGIVDDMDRALGKQQLLAAKGLI